MNRRRLIAASLAVPALAPGALARMRTNEKITLGLIGMGIRGRNMLRRYWLANEGFQVVAVCDVDTSRREDAKRRVDEAYGNSDCTAHVDYGEVLARDEVDAVVIATPDHWHALQILDACKAGKDIYCEKPLTLTLGEAKAAMDAARTSGCVFQTGSQQRTEFGQRFIRAVELIRAGRIGDVLTVNVGVGNPPRACDLGEEALEEGLDWDRWLGPAPLRPYNSVLSPRGVHGHYPRWRDYWEYAGGGLADMGAHHFDIAQWGLGMDASGPVRVEPPTDPSSRRGAEVVYANGTRLTHGGPSGATFIGTEGMIHVDRGRLSSIPGGILEGELDSGEELPRPRDHAEDWRQAILTRGRPSCDVEVGARSVAVCQLMGLAYRHGRALDWDPDAWQFVGPDAPQEWLDVAHREGYSLEGR